MVAEESYVVNMYRRDSWLRNQFNLIFVCITMIIIISCIIFVYTQYILSLWRGQATIASCVAVTTAIQTPLT